MHRALTFTLLALTGCFSVPIWSVDHRSPDVTTVTVQRVYGHTESTVTVIPPEVPDGG